MNELSYSFHIGNDKNKSKKSRQAIKNNKVKDKVFNNNAIQNANHLSRVNNHNLRKYDNNQELIEIIFGTNNLYDDVKNLYKSEFENARIKYNEKQIRNDRKIENYFEHISKNDKNDLACEIIIELGDMYFWKDKDEDFKRKMTDVFKEQLESLEKVVPDFKVANATIHYDESSPHLHIVGVPIKNGNKNGMDKQVGKSTIFTKESLRMIQDTMRVHCINSFNKIYNTNKKLKDKEDGRGYDIASRDMAKKYGRLKRQADKNKQRLEKVNESTKKTLEKSKQVKEIISNLKPTKITKNNFVINEEEIKVINEYIENVDINVSDIKNVDDLTSIMEDFENSLKSHDEQVNNLQSTIKTQSRKITLLEKNVTKKQDTIAEQITKINDLNNDIEELEKRILSLEEIIEKLKKLWEKLLKFLQNKFYNSEKEDDIYDQVINDFYEEEILNDEDVSYINDYSHIRENNDDYDL